MHRLAALAVGILAGLPVAGGLAQDLDERMVLAQAFHYAAGKVKGSLNSGCAEVPKAAPFDGLVVFYVGCSRSRPIYVQYNQNG